MRLKDYLFLIGLSAPVIANAQEVVTTAGGNMANNTIQASWTIGEAFTETTVTNKPVVTAGFNQPILMVETSVENIKSKVNVTVFPNPTSQFVNIKYDGQLPIKAKILSLSGTIISITELKDQTSQLDFSNNVIGVYLIEITDKSGKSNTYRIVKQ